MFFRKFLYLVFGLLPTDLIAAPEGNVVVATCQSGSGCDCMLSDMTQEEARILLGEAPPPEMAEPLLVQTSSGFVWSHVPARDLDLVLGGNGTCELALFPAIVPNDGTWRGTPTGQRVSGCPPGLEARLVPGLATVNETRVMRWGGVFRPDQMANPNGSPIQWTKVTEDRYTGTMPMPSTGPMTISAVWDSEIKDPDYIRSDVDIRIQSSAAQAALIGLANCQINVVVDFRRIGN